MSPLLLATLVALGAVGIYLGASGQLSNLSSGVSSTAAGLTVALMGNLTASQIAQYAATAGWSGADLAIAIAVAQAESDGNPQAVGDISLAPLRGPSKGLWQVNIGSNANPQYANDNLFDPQTNANDAYEIYLNAGSSFSPWSTFTGGQYQTYLAGAQVAAAGTANA
jgi:hypothetical protein